MMQRHSGPAIILVNPQMGENIGAAARAMLNCGLSDLRLVAPRDGWPNEAATRNASGAINVIETARLYPDLASAIADCRLVMATTARLRDMAKPVWTPAEAAQNILRTDQEAGRAVSAIVFGPERSGLVNEDVTCCDAILNIPLNPEYTSLNLAQAVLLTAYHWFDAANAAYAEKEPAHRQAVQVDAARKAQVENLLSHLTDALDDVAFFPTGEQRPTMVQNLRNMFQRMQLTVQEVQTFHGIVKALHGKPWRKKD